MADVDIVQKDEIALGRRRGRHFPRKRERRIAHLADCAEGPPGATVAKQQSGARAVNLDPFISVEGEVSGARRVVRRTCKTDRAATLRGHRWRSE
jgi:hypothetical protein